MSLNTKRIFSVTVFQMEKEEKRKAILFDFETFHKTISILHLQATIDAVGEIFIGLLTYEKLCFPVDKTFCFWFSFPAQQFFCFSLMRL